MFKTALFYEMGEILQMGDRTIRCGIDSAQLKWLGIIFMTLDHIGVYVCQTISVHPLRVVGRIAAPLFLYVVVNSAHHTRNKGKYALRLYLAHVLICLATVCLTSAGGDIFGNYGQFSVLSTYVYVVLLIWGIENIQSQRKKKRHTLRSWLFILAIIFVPIMAMLLFGRFGSLCEIFLPNILTVPYSPLFILMGICWYFVKDKARQILILAGFSSFSLVGAQIMNHASVMIFTGFFNTVQFFMILFCPFIYMYNGEKGRSGKYFFYIYYPLHVFVLMFIGQRL